MCLKLVPLFRFEISPKFQLNFNSTGSLTKFQSLVLLPPSDSGRVLPLRASARAAAFGEPGGAPPAPAGRGRPDPLVPAAAGQTAHQAGLSPPEEPLPHPAQRSQVARDVVPGKVFFFKFMFLTMLKFHTKQIRFTQIEQLLKFP